MSSLGNYASVGLLECDTLLANNIEGNIDLIDICVNTLSLKDKWEFSLDAQNNFFLTNKMVNVVGISGNNATGKMYINDDNQGVTTLDGLTDVSGTTLDGSIMFYNAGSSEYQFTNDFAYGGSNVLIKKPLLFREQDINIFHLNTDVSKNINIGGEKRLNLTTFNNISIGNGAGRTSQGIGTSVTGASIAIGLGAGDASQNYGAIAIGRESGLITQGENGIAIGEQSGRQSQSNYSIAIGFEAGKVSQGFGGVAIGYLAGMTNQGLHSFAMGTGAGKTDLSENAIALGNLSALINSGKNSVYIGASAGVDGNNHENVVVLNGTGNSLNPDTNNSTFIKPLRATTTGTTFVKYNATNGEMTHSNESLQPQMDDPSINTPFGTGSLTLVNGTGIKNKLSYTPPSIAGLQPQMDDPSINTPSGTGSLTLIDGTGIKNKLSYTPPAGFSTANPTFTGTVTAGSLCTTGQYAISNNRFKVDSNGYIRLSNVPNGSSVAEWDSASGNIVVTTLYYISQVFYSDDRIKSNKRDISNATNILMKLKPVQYEKHSQLIVPEGVEDTDLSGVEHFTETGFVAQEVEKIPELSYMVEEIKYTKDKLKGIKTNNLIAYLVKAFQEQETRIQALENK